MPANFSANIDGKFIGLVFPGLQALPKKNHSQNCPEIVGSPLQFHFIKPLFFTPIFYLQGRPRSIVELFWYESALAKGARAKGA